MEASLNYLIRQPKIKNDKKSPVIFLIHGYGSNKEDLFSFAEELPEEFAVVSVEAPYKMPDFQWFAWYSIELNHNTPSFDVTQAISSRDKIAFFIDEICEKFNFDKEKITLLGFSQGCILSLALAISFPEKIKRVVGLSGYLEEKIIEENFSEKDFSNTKIYLSHGIYDPIIPIQWAENGKNILLKNNIHLLFETYPMGHSISPQNFYSFCNWLKNNCL